MAANWRKLLQSGVATASDISDFDTEVGNNSAVAANTAKTGITTTQANHITANVLKLSGIASSADVTGSNTCNTPGLLTTGTQTIAGAKTFSSSLTASSIANTSIWTANVYNNSSSDHGSIKLTSSPHLVSFRVGAESGTAALVLDDADDATFAGDVIVKGNYVNINAGGVNSAFATDSDCLHFIADSNANGGSENPFEFWHNSATIDAGTKLVHIGNSGDLWVANDIQAVGSMTAGTFNGALSGNASGSSGSCTGNSATATVLATSRNFQTNLASTSTAGFTGAANCSPGVTGTLPVGNGGTGLTSVSTLLNSNVTSVSGNAGTATVLATARDIAGQSFNGSAAITIDIGDLDNVTVSDSAATGGATGDIWIEY